MPRNRNIDFSGITEDQVRDVLSGGGWFEPGAAEQYAAQFPGLATELAPYLPKTPATLPTTPTTPTGTTGTGNAGTDLPDWLQQWSTLNEAMQGAQRRALGNRIPGAESLEQTSSDVIAGLLNPPGQFADIDRRAAELSGTRGILGSGAGSEIGYRMTEEERLRRQMIGQQMLTGALGRNPIAAMADPFQTYITPAEREKLDQEWQRIKNELRRTGLSEDELELARRRFELERANARRLGVGTGEQWFNVAGSGYDPVWQVFDPASGRWG